MKAIDMRCRPPYKSWKIGMFGDSVYPVLENKAKKRRTLLPPSVKAESMELLLKELEEIDAIGVAPVREMAGGNNDDIADLVTEYPKQFIGIASINALKTEEALAKIDKYITNGKAKGVIIEHAWTMLDEQWYINDKRAYPVYEKLQELDIPMMITYGGNGAAKQDYYNPKYLDELAYDFPKLRMIMCHGGYPFVMQACHVVLSHKNLYISPDVYMRPFAFGFQDYITAANYSLQDKFLFGSAYPVTGTAEAMEFYKVNLSDEVIDKVLYKNAMQIFKL